MGWIGRNFCILLHMECICKGNFRLRQRIEQKSVTYVMDWKKEGLKIR